MTPSVPSPPLPQWAGQRAMASRASGSLCVWLVALAATALATAGEVPLADAPSFSTLPQPVQAVARQGPCEITVELSPAMGRVCDDLSLRLSIRHPKNAAVKKVELGGQAEAFLVRESREETPQPRGDDIVSERQYVLEPLQAGKLAIGPVEVTVALAGAAEVVLRTQAIPVELHTVVALPPRLEALRPMAGPPPAPAPSPGTRFPWEWTAALGVVVLVLGSFVWRWASQRVPRRVPGSPRAEARRRLAELVANGHVSGDIKAFYIALADIVRQYLVQAAGVPALEQTSEECLCTVAQRGVLSAEAAEMLARFFRSADRVKFGRFQPQPAEVSENVRQVELIVEAPVFLPQPAPGEHFSSQPEQAAGEHLSAQNVEAAP